MGEVYRASDSRLNRDVAIKLIAETFARNATRLRRFEQEARAAGQLNHPNILSVYDVGVDDGRPYIVSELLEGRSLREALTTGGVPWRTAVTWARQIVEGLAAAHDKRIVHRDIKPDNVFVTTDGRVKILDFGIAKLTAEEQQAVPAWSATDTADGVVVGTAAYMSPEQIRGEALDGRSDLFSVGALLYEMLAGRAAFARPTQAETMAAVLKEFPEVPTETPAGLARIVSRCLEKAADARFQSARDLAFGLDVLSDTGGLSGAAAKSRRRPYAAAAVVLTVLAAGGAAWLSQRDSALEENPLVNARFTALTDWAGTEALAEISPDGRFVAFLSDRDGEFDIWLTQVGTGEFRNLTTDIPGMSAPGVVLRNFGFTGDGSAIWFSLSGRPGDRKMLMPLLGGAVRPFLGEGDVTPAWSPDGTQVAYFNNKEHGGDPIFLADRTGADAHLLLPPEHGVLHNHNPAWSTDGRWIYFVRGVEPSSQMDVWRIRSTGGTPERLTTQSSPLNYLAPIDPRTVLYVSRSDDRSGPWLWALDVESRVARRLSAGVEEYTSIAASHDGRRVVVTVARPTSTVWTVPIQTQPADNRQVERHRVTTPRATAPRLGPTALFYLASRGADAGLWRFEGGRVLQIWKGEERTLSEPPAISQDGQRVAIAVRQGSARRVVVMSADGTNVHSLAPSLTIEGAPLAGALDWSPDGQWLVAGGRDGSGPGLFRIPLDGAPPVKLVQGQATSPIWSPRGDLIVYAGTFVDGQVPLLGVRPDGTPVSLPPVRAREGGYRFMPDGRGIVFLPMLRSLDFSLLDLSTGRQRVLTRLSDGGRLQNFDISRDGKQIVFDRLQENSDIVLIERN
jgi:Tol biopolymer transport system component